MATDSPSFSANLGSLWTCALGAGGPLHAVVLMGNACVAFEEIFSGVPFWIFVTVVVSSNAPSEGMVVLKDMDCTGFLH